MNVLLPSLATTLMVCAAISTASAQSVQWESFGGPDGGSVVSMARTPDGTMLATLDGEGLFRSDDRGSSWKLVVSPSTPRWSEQINATSAGTLLLAGSDSLLRRSTDMGASWTVVSDRLNWQIPLVQDSAGGVIGAGYDGIYRSTDDGASWARTGSAIPGLIGALAVGSDGRLVAGVEDYANLRGVQTSTDLGVTWRFVQIGDSNTPLVGSLAALPDGRLLAGSRGRGLFRSEDGGATWTLVPLSDADAYHALLVLPDGSIVAGTGGRGVHRSNDGGMSWQPVGPTDGGPQIATLAATEDGRILAGTWYSGVFAVEPIRWKHSSSGLPRLGAWKIAFGSDGMIHMVAMDGRLYSSSDNGAGWAESGIRRGGATVLAVDRDNRVYVSKNSYSSYGLSVSTDRGDSWATLPGLQGEQVLALHVGRHDHLYVGVERGAYTYHSSATDGLFHSSDRGTTWTSIGTGLQGVSPVSIVELGDGTLFIGAQYGKRVYRLTPGDTLWREMSSGLPAYRYPRMLNALVADQKENLYAAMQQGLFRSSDRGVSWQNVGTGLGDTMVTALAVSPSGTVYAATRSTGVHASDDNGATWRYLGDAPGSPGFHMLGIDSSGAIIAGGYAGLYRGVSTSSVPVSGQRIEAGLVASPNPSGTRMSVEFEMASAGSARLTLYNSLGQQVAVVLEGERGVGVHRIELDCSGHLPGSYLLRLETRQGSQQIGVVVVR